MSVSSEPQAVVRFGVFEADLRAGELRRNGIKVKIQDLPFRALTLLLSRPNEVVTRDEFRQTLWPQDVFVDFDRGISSALKRLRDALGDSADNPRFIETIDRRGYRWIAPTSIAPVAIVPPALTPVTIAPSRASDSDSGATVPSDTQAESEIPPQLPSSGAWKLVYVLPLLTLIFVVWTFRPGANSAKAGLNSQRTPAKAGTPLHPANQEAKDNYLQGRYYWNKRTPDDLHKAVDFFTQAIVHDPGYSDAYVGLADCYNLLREYTAMPASEAFPRALAASRKAVELDGQSSQAHASFAFASFWGAWDFTTADREFRRAIELDPSNATAHHWYANVLGTIGRYPEALAHIERAQALDPTSKSILADKGAVLHQMGRTPESIALLQQLEKAEPDFLSPHRYLKGLYLEMADYPNYLAESQKEAALTKDSGAKTVADAAEKGYASGGARGMFENMRREQQRLYDQGKLSPYVLAETDALEGNKQDTLKYLKAAYDQRDERTTHLPTDHVFDNLRNEPIYRQIMTELAFSQAQSAPTSTSNR